MPFTTIRHIINIYTANQSKPYTILSRTLLTPEKQDITMATAKDYVTSDGNEVTLWPSSCCTACFLSADSAKYHQERVCRNYVCGCGESFTMKRDLTKHFTDATEVDQHIRWLRCQCQLVLGNAGDFTRHCLDCPIQKERLREGLNEGEVGRCYICREILCSKTGLKQHMSRHESDPAGDERTITASPKSGNGATSNAGPRPLPVEPKVDSFSISVPRTWAP